jgi:hypothetical protein
MNKLAQNKKIISLANKIADAVKDDTEVLLYDLESTVKKYVPARFVKSVLNKLEASLANDGVEAKFDKSVTRELIRSTASVENTQEELKEATDTFAKAFVSEMEDTLKQADEACDEVIKRIASKENSTEVELKLKSMVENRLAMNCGIYCKLARSKQAKEVVHQAIRKLAAAKKAEKAKKAEAMKKAAKYEKIKAAIKKIKASKK